MPWTWDNGRQPLRWPLQRTWGVNPWDLRQAINPCQWLSHKWEPLQKKSVLGSWNVKPGMLSTNWLGLIMPRWEPELAIMPGCGRNHNNGQGHANQHQPAQRSVGRIIRLQTIMIMCTNRISFKPNTANSMMMDHSCYKCRDWGHISHNCPSVQNYTEHGQVRDYLNYWWASRTKPSPLRTTPHPIHWNHWQTSRVQWGSPIPQSRPSSMVNWPSQWVPGGGKWCCHLCSHWYGGTNNHYCIYFC